MKTLLDILQGIGVSCAEGIRPFLPTLVVGGLATADIGVDFDGTQFAFLESEWFLLAITVALVISILFRARLETPTGVAILQGIGIGLGALLFAGALDDRHDVWWPGLVGGVLCAAFVSTVVRALLTRTKVRLDAAAAAALFLYAEAAALVLAGLSVLVPPVGLLGLGFFVWLRAAGRRREGEKYAGLRILR
jgi:Domain of unknown function (DUF4126)